MTLDDAKTHAGKIHAALIEAEHVCGKTDAMQALHSALNDGLTVLADHFAVAPATILPLGGTNKP